MIEKIFNLIFEKKKDLNCITVVKKRDMKSVPPFYLKHAQNNSPENTCLSQYFSGRKGLGEKRAYIDRDAFNVSNR